MSTSRARYNYKGELPMKNTFEGRKLTSEPKFVQKRRNLLIARILTKMCQLLKKKSLKKVEKCLLL